jgi:hypothetical protein
MSNQAEPGTLGSAPQQPGALSSAASGQQQEPAGFVSQVPGTAVTFPVFHGRPVSWVAVSTIMAGFIVGGLALVFGPTWPVFWIGLGMVAAGGLLALATKIFEDWY